MGQHRRVVDGQSVFVVSVSLRGTEDCIALAVECDCMYWLPLRAWMGSLVGVKLGKWEVCDVEELVGRGLFGGLVDGIATWFLSG